MRFWSRPPGGVALRALKTPLDRGRLPRRQRDTVLFSSPSHTAHGECIVPKPERLLFDVVATIVAITLNWTKVRSPSPICR